MFEGKHDYLSPPGNTQPVVRHVLIILSRMVVRWIGAVREVYSTCYFVPYLVLGWPDQGK